MQTDNRHRQRRRRSRGLFDDDNGPYSGSAYLFDITTGQQIAKFLSDDGEANDHFGISVAISGTLVIVGAYTADSKDFSRSGAAYLFDISNPANPIQTAKILPSDNGKDDRFGSSVAISGTTAIIGRPLDDENGNNSGSAYAFDVSDPENPIQMVKFLPKNGAANDKFGESVAISPDGIGTAIVGAQYEDDNGTESGSAYLFDAASAKNCPWDLDNSASVGTSDLLALFAQWGTDGSADFDESGVVGTSDLLILFANWGPCS